jgi:hypothetical protein
MTTANKLFLDIETIPPANGGHFERIRAGIRPPAQYKKPESIAEWMAENADRCANEELARLGLNGLYGEICVIGFAVGDGPVDTARTEDGHERGLIEFAFEAITALSVSDRSGYEHGLQVVGHNIEFDIRFLFHRAVRHGIRIPKCIRPAFDPDKGRYNTFDTMKVWSGYRDFVKLKDLARELLGDTCEDIDGSEVAGLWATNPEKVVEHCRQDVERVRALYRKFKAVL